MSLGHLIEVVGVLVPPFVRGIRVETAQSKMEKHATAMQREIDRSGAAVEQAVVRLAIGGTPVVLTRRLSAMAAPTMRTLELVHRHMPAQSGDTVRREMMRMTGDPAKGRRE